MGKTEVGKKKETRWDGFRIFKPVATSADEPSTREKRALNAVANPAFDYHRQTLFDYPTIIAGKLDKADWRPHNRLASVHIPRCNLECWHCYNDAWPGSEGVSIEPPVTARQIIDHFLEQWGFDGKLGLSTRVLRITGGEPFLEPDLIRECAGLLAAKSRELGCDFFLWTETNLIPLICASGQGKQRIDDCLRVLGQNSRMTVVHPCCHGVEESSGAENSGPMGRKLSVANMTSALRWLIDKGVDIYPTIHANAVPPERLEPFFDALVSVHPNLPLRFALIELELKYEAAQQRLKKCINRDPKPQLRSKYAALWEWNRLVEDAYGLSYGVMPRHQVSLEPGATLVKREKRGAQPALPYQPEVHQRELCILKSAKRTNYRQHALRLLALPEGWIASAEYKASWVDQDVAEGARAWPELFREFPACLLYFEEDDSSRGDHAFVPFRKATVLKVDVQGELVHVKYRLGPLFDPLVKPEDYGRLRGGLFDLYGASVLPPGGHSYIALGCPISGLSASKQSVVGRWEAAAEKLAGLGPKALHDCAFLLVEKMSGADPDTPSDDGSSSFWRAKAGSDLTLTIRWSVPASDLVQHTMHIQSSSPDALSIVGVDRIAFSRYGDADIKLHCAHLNHTQTVCIDISCTPDPTKAASLSLPVRIVAPDLLTEAAKEGGTAISSGIAGGAVALGGFLGGQYLVADEPMRSHALSALSSLGPWLLGGFVVSGLLAAFLRSVQRRRGE